MPTRRFSFHTCDVFTDTRFGGNPLAVFPRAEGLSDVEMQQIAREFNFAETAFVFAGGPGFTRRVRIFTPTMEVPFAGHPNVGTAAMLATHGELGEVGASMDVVFDERAGRVAVHIVRLPGARFRCDLTAPAPLRIGARVPAAAVAAATGLAEEDVLTTAHPPQLIAVGLEFLVAELRDVGALRRARPSFEGLLQLEALGAPFLHCYVRSGDAFNLRTRGFAAHDPGMEDPATGSANAALAAMLAHHDPGADGDFAWRIAQGVEMGRPSVLDARVEKRGGGVTRVRIGGEVVPVTTGTLEV